MNDLVRFFNNKSSKINVLMTGKGPSRVLHHPSAAPRGGIKKADVNHQFISKGLKKFRGDNSDCVLDSGVVFSATRKDEIAGSNTGSGVVDTAAAAEACSFVAAAINGFNGDFDISGCQNKRDGSFALSSDALMDNGSGSCAQNSSKQRLNPAIEEKMAEQASRVREEEE